MDVIDILDIKTIQTNMNVKTKDEALRELARLLCDNEYVSDAEGFIEDIYAREAEGQTGIGNYIAIPHGKSSQVKKIGVAIGINQSEIPWETLDGKGVKGIILFAVGKDNDGAKNHLKLLSLFARKLGNDEIVNKLIEADMPIDVINAFAN